MIAKMTREEYLEKYGTEPFTAATQAVAAIEEPTGNTGVKGLLTGVGKSAVGLAQGVGEFGRGIQRGISEGIGAVTGVENFGMSEGVFDKGSEANQKLTDLATPRTTSESIGKFAGDVAQFAIPGGAAAKATKGAGVLTKTAAAGGTDAAVQTIQQGGVSRATLDTAILGAIFPAAAKLKEGARITIGANAGARFINSVIKPVTKQFSYGKNPGRAVAELGIKASSLEDLSEGITKARQNTGTALSAAAKQVPTTVKINAGEALSSFDEAIKKAVANNDQALLNRLNEARDAIVQTRSLSNGKIVPTGTRLLDKLTYEQAAELKRKIGDITKWTGQKTEDETVNGALSRAYGALKGQMDEVTRNVNPKLATTLKKLNEQYADLTSADIAARNRDALAQRANLISMPVKFGAGAAIATTILTGGAITPALLVGLGAAGMEKALSTVAAKTRIAAWLASAPPQELKSLWKQAPWLRGVLQASMFAEEGDNNSPNKGENYGNK